MSTATQTIQTFEDACSKLQLDPSTVLPEVSNLPNGKALLALAKLFIIIEAINDGWKPDWNNYDEYKYYPWFDLKKEENNPSGFRLDGVVYDCTYSRVGSRLCFASREKAEYAAKQFEDLYKDYFLI